MSRILTPKIIQSDDMDILQKNGPKRPFLPEIGGQTFFTPIIAAPIACCALFHDKAKRTQQSNLLIVTFLL